MGTIDPYYINEALRMVKGTVDVSNRFFQSFHDGSAESCTLMLYGFKDVANAALVSILQESAFLHPIKKVYAVMTDHLNTPESVEKHNGRKEFSERQVLGLPLSTRFQALTPQEVPGHIDEVDFFFLTESRCTLDEAMNLGGKEYFREAMIRKNLPIIEDIAYLFQKPSDLQVCVVTNLPEILAAKLLFETHLDPAQISGFSHADKVRIDGYYNKLLALKSHPSFLRSEFFAVGSHDNPWPVLSGPARFDFGLGFNEHALVMNESQWNRFIQDVQAFGARQYAARGLAQLKRPPTSDVTASAMREVLLGYLNKDRLLNLSVYHEGVFQEGPTYFQHGARMNTILLERMSPHDREQQLLRAKNLESLLQTFSITKKGTIIAMPEMMNPVLVPSQGAPSPTAPRKELQSEDLLVARNTLQPNQLIIYDLSGNHLREIPFGERSYIFGLTSLDDHLIVMVREHPKHGTPYCRMQVLDLKTFHEQKTIDIPSVDAFVVTPQKMYYTSSDAVRGAIQVCNVPGGPDKKSFSYDNDNYLSLHVTDSHLLACSPTKAVVWLLTKPHLGSIDYEGAIDRSTSLSFPNGGGLISFEHDGKLVVQEIGGISGVRKRLDGTFSSFYADEQNRSLFVVDPKNYLCRYTSPTLDQLLKTDEVMISNTKVPESVRSLIITPRSVIAAGASNCYVFDPSNLAYLGPVAFEHASRECYAIIQKL